MIKYSLVQLILFFKTQSLKNYKSIDSLLYIIETDTIPDSEKGMLVIELLRHSGLFEVGYDDGSMEIESTEMVAIQKGTNLEEIQRDGILFPVEIFELNLMNNTIRIGILMN